MIDSESFIITDAEDFEAIPDRLSKDFSAFAEMIHTKIQPQINESLETFKTNNIELIQNQIGNTLSTVINLSTHYHAQRWEIWNCTDYQDLFKLIDENSTKLGWNSSSLYCW